MEYFLTSFSSKWRREGERERGRGKEGGGRESDLNFIYVFKVKASA